MFGHSPRLRAAAPALALAIVLTAASAFGAGQVGETAPAFTLDALDAGPVSLSDYAGQVVLLSIIGYG